MLPKITIITPSYSQGSYIEQTIITVSGEDKNADINNQY